MSRRHHYKKNDEQVELDITTFLNLMVVLIPFLLVSAVFSTIAIQELNISSQAASDEKPDKPPVTIEVIVRKDKLQLSDGKNITATFKKEGEKYDLPGLSKALQALKAKNADKQDATLLIEPEIEYEDVIHVMDAVKVAEIKQEGVEEVERMVLFPQLSLGEAP